MSIGTAGSLYPYPGLRPFREEEEFLFFGRENQVDSMVDRLAAKHFLAVIGTSGSGKSSLVNCGLRPALRAGLMAKAGTTWRMAQFRPGNDPLGRMAMALSEDGVLFHDYQAAGLTLTDIVDTTLRMSKLGLIDIYEQAKLPAGVNLLIVVDQFEELFRYRQVSSGAEQKASDIAEQAAAFVNLLLEAAAQTTYPVYVVLTMRSDFLDDCTQFPGLAEAINAGQYLVPRMTRDERRAAITGPAGVAGAEISPVLLTRLINDVGDNPDQLSILQHALNRTWARWLHESGAEGPVDLSHYESIGTMANALDQHAERAFAELDTPRRQQVCEKIFKALTDKATDPRGIRRPTTIATLCALANAADSEVAEVIEIFRKISRSFLMPPAGEPLLPGTVIDVSHESLMRVWQRLIKWADVEARSARIYRRLAETASLHAAGNASLWRDAELAYAQEWKEREAPNATWADRYAAGFEHAMAFLQSSEASHVAELDETRQDQEADRLAKEREMEYKAQAESERAKLELQTRAARRQRQLLYGMALLLVGMVAVTLFAFDKENQAVLASNEAVTATKMARKATDEAMKANEGARKLIQYMDAQIVEAFAQSVPLQLRERVNAKVEAFHTEHGLPESMAVGELISYYLRKARVHLDSGQRYQNSRMAQKSKNLYILWEHKTAADDLNMAIRLCDTPTAKALGDRGIVRDLILAHYYLAMLSMLSKDAAGSATHLRDAQAIMDGLTKATTFPQAHWLHWMGLPNLEACTGDATSDLAAMIAGIVSLKPKLAGPASGTDVAQSHSNGLGMRFVPIPGIAAQFSTCQTRVKDFRQFIRETGYVHMRETADENSGMWSWDQDGYKQRGHSWKDPGFQQTEEHPVVGVSWIDANAFCNWLTLRERAGGKLPAGWEYRLPTDHEWSMAAGLDAEEATLRPDEKDGKILDRYFWGDAFPPPAQSGNYAGKEARDGHLPLHIRILQDYRDEFPRTAPVGTFKPNRYGLFDLGGNVMEWCEDKFETGGKYENRTVRGASWLTSNNTQMLSSRRDCEIPMLRCADYGFRCVAAPASR